MSASVKQIRKLLTERLTAITPEITTVEQNDAKAVLAGQPFQKVALLFAQPSNPVRGPEFYREQGFFQVDLRYPLNTGVVEIEDRAKKVRDQFPYGLGLGVAPTIVTINLTPQILAQGVEGNTYRITIRISWHANMQG